MCVCVCVCVCVRERERERKRERERAHMSSGLISSYLFYLRMVLLWTTVLCVLSKLCTHEDSSLVPSLWPLFAELVTVWTMGVRGCPINSAASKSADLLELVSA